MYYVYVLQSIKDKKMYIGYTPDLKSRFKKHNSGMARSTKSRLPLTLVYYEAYLNKNDAIIRERHLKTHQQRDLLKEKLKNSLE